MNRPSAQGRFIKNAGVIPRKSWILRSGLGILCAELREDQAMNEAKRRFTILHEGLLRLIRPDERVDWDETMAEQHYLGFKKFPGRALRYVYEHEGVWLALVGWQASAWKCQPRDQWIGWSQKMQMARLHLIANNSRFLLMRAGLGVPNLASRVLGENLRRLDADWQEVHGHGLEMAETFTDTTRFRGTVYHASNWIHVGQTRGFARYGASYTKQTETVKDMFVYPLRRNAVRRLNGPEERKEWKANRQRPNWSSRELESLSEMLEKVPDPRGAKGRRHSLKVLLSLQIIGRLCGWHGPVAVADLASMMEQEELAALGARWRPRRQRYVPPSAPTLCRILQHVDPEALEGVLEDWCRQLAERKARQSSKSGPLAGGIDGKRSGRFSRTSPDGRHLETLTLVDHATGIPVAMRTYGDAGGELAAAGQLLDEVDIQGRVITADALHATFENEHRIERAEADYVLTVKGNAPETYAALKEVDWEAAATGTYRQEAPAKAKHGRIEAREIHVYTPLPGAFKFRNAKQAFRVTRWRTPVKGGKKGETSVTYAYGLASTPASKASPRQLLEWNRGHWSVENNHQMRDVSMDEDRSSLRARNAPANNAICNNIALALIRHEFPGKSLNKAKRQFQRSSKLQARALTEPQLFP